MGELEPRRDVAVVVETGQTISSPSRSSDRRGAREREVERRHVRAEGDLVDGRSQEAGRRRVRVRDERVGAP